MPKLPQQQHSASAKPDFGHTSKLFCFYFLDRLEVLTLTITLVKLHLLWSFRFLQYSSSTNLFLVNQNLERKQQIHLGNRCFSCNSHSAMFPLKKKDVMLEI